MTHSEYFDRFETAFHSESPEKGLYGLAVSLRDDGMRQIELYFLFEHFLLKTPENDPHYNSILDTMDLIWGGGWAKGRQLYPIVLTNDEIEFHRQNQRYHREKPITSA